MRWAVACGLVFSGCASIHSTLAAELDADYDTVAAYDARCLTRGERGQLEGAELSFELGRGAHGDLIALEGDAAIWGRATTDSGVAYRYGQLCASPRRCASYLFFEDAERRVWIRVDATRPASDHAALVALLQEGHLIDQGAALVTTARQRAVFEEVSTELESAADTRSSIFGKLFIGIGSVVTDISASMTEASASIEAQLQLAPLMAFLAEHNVMLWGGRHGELRLFEVVRTICISPTRPPQVAQLGGDR